MRERENPIPPKSEWKNLSVNQLYDIKIQMMNIYYNMRSANATFANQYMNFINELDSVILHVSSAEKEEQD